MTVLQLKNLIAKNLGYTAASDLVLNTVDGGLASLNAARRKAEQIRDFKYSEVLADLSIATGGTLLSAATVSSTAISVKRVKDVLLPIASSEYIPVEFLTEEEWIDRRKRQVGRAAYSATATAAEMGISQTNPTAYMLGQTMLLAPASQFSFPVAAKISVVKFLADYTADGDTDFFTTYAPQYLQWQATLELNKWARRFAPKQEGNIDEKAIEEMAATELQSLLAWDDSIRQGTTTPPGTDATKAPK